MPAGLFEDSARFVFDHQVLFDATPAYYGLANETKNMTGAGISAQYAPSRE